MKKKSEVLPFIDQGVLKHRHKSRMLGYADAMNGNQRNPPEGCDITFYDHGYETALIKLDRGDV